MLLGLLGIVAGLGLLIWLSYRGWSVLLLAPAAAIVAAAAAGEPLLAHWTETFMGGAAKFLAQFRRALICTPGGGRGKTIHSDMSTSHCQVDQQFLL